MQFWHAGLIPGVISSFADSTPIDKYQFINDRLVFALPGSNERQTVPPNYWGKTVYSATLGQFITLPNAPGTDAVKPSQTSVSDDDFWRQ